MDADQTMIKEHISNYRRMNIEHLQQKDRLRMVSRTKRLQRCYVRD